MGGGSWVYARMGLLDGIAATNRKEPNHLESSSFGMEVGFHLLRRAGYTEDWIADVARTIEYKAAYDIYHHDVEYSLKTALTLRNQGQTR